MLVFLLDHLSFGSSSFFPRFSSSGKSEKVYLVGGKRTPFGKFGESLKDITPVELGVYATKATFQETKIKPEQIGKSKRKNCVC